MKSNYFIQNIIGYNCRKKDICILNIIFDKKKDKYGLNDEPNSGAESMKSKILNKEEDPFSDVVEVKEISDLPF